MPLASAHDYRAGPHPVRDVVAYCGRDNRAADLAAMGRPAPAGEVGGLHHWWLEADGLVLDLSPPDWRDYGAGPEVAAREMELYGRSEGDMVWTHEPPAYVWHRRGEGIVLPTAPGEPPPGKAYYTAEPAIPAGRAASVAATGAELERALATARPAFETEVRLGGAAAA